MLNVISANTDIAHTTGNVTFLMIERLKSFFEHHFFHHIHIASRMPYREFMLQENRDKDQFIKKNRPILVVRPRVTIGNDDIFMSRSRLTSIIMDADYAYQKSGLIKLFRDNVNDITVSYLMNRMRISLDCIMMFDTEYQQTNVYSALRNRINENQIYWMNTATEIFFPKDLINLISQKSGIPVRDPDTGLVRKFLDYLISNSNKYFTFKERTSTQSEEFFVYYPGTVELVYTDFSRDDMDKHGDVTGSANIRFTMHSEFNTIGMYRITGEPDDVGLRANQIIHLDTVEEHKIVPFYTPPNLFGVMNKDGYKLFYSNIFFMDKDVPRKEPDILDLSGLFKDSSLTDIIAYHEKNGISNNILFEFIIMKNGEILNSDPRRGKVDYTIDLDKQRILIYNKDYSTSYRILIYQNNYYVMTLFNRLNELESKYEKGIKKER